MADRATMIRQRIASLTRKVPEGWQGWCADQAHDFRTLLADFNTARAAKNVEQLARRLADFYGIPWVELDPGEA